MNGEELQLWGNALLIKIAVITGWSMPEGKAYTILLDQFKKKMQELYAGCNPDEVEYAFRNGSGAVKEWGKQINIPLMDEVMLHYLSKRREISLLEEGNNQLVIESKVVPLSEEDYQQWLQEEIQYLKTGKSWELIPMELYEFLDRKGAIKATNEERYEYLHKATVRRAGQLERESLNSKHAMEYFQSFKQMMDRGYLTGMERERVKTMAKKLLFFDLAQNHPPCE